MHGGTPVESFFSHSRKPVLILLLVSSASLLLYEYSIYMPAPWLHQWMSGISGMILFVCIGFGAFFVYLYSCKQGASPAERILASFVVPFFWATKEVIRVSVAFTFLESLYFYFSPLTISVFFGVVSEMGLADLVCRRRCPHRIALRQDHSLLPLVAFFGGLAVVVFILAWGKGEYTFYLFLRGFRALFGPGQGLE